ncbi:NERD domain-containing protein [Sporosarcina sp. Marseille-Q4063]|uniref:NERD domain-containing protein n=1 Tax=Sporosarcina sp. Marseille-Q4063 TaxID=2810514 RepID=UPI001BB002AA|nr:NERD domain-containing protein [Sporosarcina sp. Marseille-Q4063]QUW21455.1 NERD domain-containing protein [Sporosarcina sp. Marseille-Q4063]
MTFVKKPFLARFVDALKDKEELKTPIIVKHGDSMDLEIARLQKELADKKSPDDRKKIEQQIKYLEIGKAGEQSLLFELTNSFLPMMILHDVYIEHKGLNAQFDFIIVTRKFFMVIEVKKYYGNITVNEKGEFIRTVNRGSRTVFKEGMYSPVRQVERQVEVLQSMLKDHKIIERTPILHAVAFANEKTVIDLKKAPKNIKDKVFRSDGIVTFLKAELAKKSPMHFFDKRMQDFAEYIKGQHINKHLLENPDEEEVSFYTEEEEVPVAATVEVEPVPVSNEDLEVKLKEFRKKTADESGRKAFHIFTNKTLDSLIEIKPTTLEDLRKVPGIGDKKIEEFGAELVGIINDN